MCGLLLLLVNNRENKKLQINPDLQNPLGQYKCTYFSQVVSTSSYSEQELSSLLDNCWSSLQESRRSLAFWDVLTEFVHVAYLPCLLAMGENSVVVEKLKEVCIHVVITCTGQISPSLEWNTWLSVWSYCWIISYGFILLWYHLTWKIKFSFCIPIFKNIWAPLLRRLVLFIFESVFRDYPLRSNKKVFYSRKQVVLGPYSY